MNFDLEKAAKPLRKLRKLLKSIRSAPSPGEVHKLRIATRKLEATLHALPGEGGKAGSRALKRLQPVRKLAGKVRDMDVLISKAAPLCKGKDCEPLVMLLEELAKRREKNARKLHDLVCAGRRKSRKVLKAAMNQVDKTAKVGASSSGGATAGAEKLLNELAHWPRLQRNNLHEFRKGVKELGYMMQVIEGADERQIAAYARVKDAVGEWHDWLELQNAAEEVFGNTDNPTLRDIRSQTREHLREAMTAANALRHNGFSLNQAA